MYNLEDADFDKMTYNPKKVPKGKLFWEHYTVFSPAKNKNIAGLCTSSAKKGINTIPEEYLLTDSVLEKVFVFVVLFVDSQSPFYDETDFDTRKRNVLLYLEYASEKNKSNANMRTVLNVINSMNTEDESPVISKLIHFYFLYSFHYDYETWFSYKMLYHEQNRYLRTPLSPNNNGDVRPDAESKMKISKEMPNLQAMIEELEVKLFKDDRLKAKILEKSLDDGYAGFAEKNADNLPFIQ